MIDLWLLWDFPGGAVLVSPSKVKPPGLEQRRRASSQDGLETLKKDITKVGIYISETTSCVAIVACGK